MPRLSRLYKYSDLYTTCVIFKLNKYCGTGLSKKKFHHTLSAASTKDTMTDITKSYKDVLVDNADAPMQFQPRNAHQVTYFHSVTKSAQKIGRDAIMNLHELAYMIPGFVWTISTFPDLTVCLGLSQLLQFATINTNAVLSYDTTFCMGDFYLSFLVLTCSVFVEEPVMPVAFVLHERKFDTVHQVFFQHVRNRCPQLTKACIVTDGEAGMVKAVQAVMPEWKLTTCWNHVIRDVEFWLKKHGAGSEDIAVYKNHIHELLTCDTEILLRRKTGMFQEHWSAAFTEYFENHLSRRVDMAYSGYLLQCGLDGSGITTNASESMNAMLKRFQVLLLILLYVVRHMCNYIEEVP